MNNQREIYEALLAGETLDNGDFSCKLTESGFLVDDEGDSIELDFGAVLQWQIYKEPKWYNNIPEGGVLCWVKYSGADNVQKQCATVIKFHNLVFSTISGCVFDNAEPLTKAEIQTFMDNAPEIPE